ncbi:MAG: cyclophilin-like family protein [Burkholderiales bacterium]
MIPGLSDLGRSIRVRIHDTHQHHLAETLPYESSANTWGDEVYFNVPVKAKLEADPRQVVDSGTVCFWVEGSSLALPFGPTPVSHGDECRLVAKVPSWGKLRAIQRRSSRCEKATASGVELAQ